MVFWGLWPAESKWFGGHLIYTMFTILTRTSNRPKAYARCRQSVHVQIMPFYHIISKDSEEDDYVEFDVLTIWPEKNRDRGCNLYFNEMRRWIPQTHPWVIFLDDDDTFTRPDALDIISKNITSENDLILWRVNINGQIIPDSIPGRIEPGQVTGIGFCVHVRHWIDWQAIPAGDFDVISKYAERLNPVWIDAVLTATQGKPGLGRRIDF